MMIVSPLIETTFPFQMAFLWLVNGGDPNYLLTNWDDPPSRTHQKPLEDEVQGFVKGEGSKKVICFWKSSNLAIKRPTKMFYIFSMTRGVPEEVNSMTCPLRMRMELNSAHQIKCGCCFQSQKKLIKLILWWEGSCSSSMSNAFLTFLRQLIFPASTEIEISAGSQNELINWQTGRMKSTSKKLQALGLSIPPLCHGAMPSFLSCADLQMSVTAATRWRMWRKTLLMDNIITWDGYSALSKTPCVPYQWVHDFIDPLCSMSQLKFHTSIHYIPSLKLTARPWK